MSTLHVDWTRCDGHGLCADLLPEVLTRDEWGYPLARQADRSLDVAPAARGARPPGRRPVPAAGAQAPLSRTRIRRAPAQAGSATNTGISRSVFVW